MNARTDLKEELLLLGVDGGGTWCRARLADTAGKILGEGLAGPANIRLGLQESLSRQSEAEEVGEESHSQHEHDSGYRET